MPTDSENTSQTRAERVQEGAALILGGHSLRAAGAAVDVPPTTLLRALDKLREGTADAPDLAAADQALMGLTYRIAQRAQEAILQRLEAAEGLELREITAVSSRALNALAAFRRWNAAAAQTPEDGTGSRLLDRLEAALGTGAAVTLTVTPPRPDAHAIDVPATVVDSPRPAPAASGPPSDPGDC